MQIDSIAHNAAAPAPAAPTQVAPQGRAQSAVVQHTESGYEAYLQGTPPGPKVNGPSVELAESYLGSAVQLQA